MSKKLINLNSRPKFSKFISGLIVRIHHLAKLIELEIGFNLELLNLYLVYYFAHF